MEAHGIIAYGYDLGGGGGTLLLRETQESSENPYGELRTPWYDGTVDLDDEPGDTPNRPDVFEALIGALYAAIPGAPDGAWGSDQEKAVRGYFGVWLVDHGDCSNDYAKILAAYDESVEYGSTCVLELGTLQDRAVAQDWDGKLAAVLRRLGITPVAERPGWLLASQERP